MDLIYQGYFKEELKGYFGVQIAQYTRPMPKIVPSLSEDESCPVCMVGWRGRVTFVCGHSMCTVCFALHAQTSSVCHLCRSPVPTPRPRVASVPSMALIENRISSHDNESTDHITEFVDFMNLVHDPARKVLRTRSLFNSQYRLGIVEGLRMAYQTR